MVRPSRIILDDLAVLLGTSVAKAYSSLSEPMSWHTARTAFREGQTLEIWHNFWHASFATFASSWAAGPTALVRPLSSAILARRVSPWLARILGRLWLGFFLAIRRTGFTHGLGAHRKCGRCAWSAGLLLPLLHRGIPLCSSSSNNLPCLRIPGHLHGIPAQT